MELEQKSNGSLVGLIVIVIILVIGGIYMWQLNKDKEERIEDPAPQAVNNQDSETLNALEANINATDTSVGVDASTVN